MPARPPDPQAMRLGAALRARRIELGLSQDDLAEQLGLSRARLSAMETGRIGQMRLLLEVATALGLEILALSRENPVTASLVASQERQRHLGPRRVSNALAGRRA